MKAPVAAPFVLLYALTLQSALAAVEHGRVWQATYVAAYQPTFGRQGVPYSGTMKLKFNNGIITGTYLAESVRPDPLYGRTINVSGGVSQGQHHRRISKLPAASPCAARWRKTAKFPARRPSKATSTAFSPR